MHPWREHGRSDHEPVPSLNVVVFTRSLATPSRQLLRTLSSRPHPAGAERVVRACFLLSIAFASLACGKNSVSRDECLHVLDRYVEQQVRRENPKAGSTAIERAQNESRRRAATSTSFASCSHEMTREQYTCAMGAWDPDAIERCLVPIL
jgi:hypothetical protein